jgi:parallel beta-helix repeat protein
MTHAAAHSSTPGARPASRGTSLVLAFASLVLLPAAARAADLCVNQHGGTGCVTTIAAAVAAAAPGDTIRVAPGTYHEDVVLVQSVSLVGADPFTTIIDATALANGVYVDGLDNTGITEVLITGFTIQNANFEGVLVQGAADVTVSGNIVRKNDQSLQASGAACPGLPAFETAEASDCGQGIHLIATTHSTVADNLITGNAGGILITDETNTSHDNVVARNLIRDNQRNAGVTLASHPAYAQPGVPQPNGPVVAFGVYNNSITENELLCNGASGVLIFAASDSERVYANQVTANLITGNSGAGVAIRNGAFVNGSKTNPDVSRNAILGNFIADNGADPSFTSKASTGIAIFGVAPITDLVITQNHIEHESIAITTVNPASLDVHLNSFIGGVAIADPGFPGITNARENWWGCSEGPGNWGCSTIAAGAIVAYDPWLTYPAGPEIAFDYSHHYCHHLDCDHDRW